MTTTGVYTKTVNYHCFTKIRCSQSMSTQGVMTVLMGISGGMEEGRKLDQVLAISILACSCLI